jgi:hypothetical protein
MITQCGIAARAVFRDIPNIAKEKTAQKGVLPVCAADIIVQSGAEPKSLVLNGEKNVPNNGFILREALKQVKTHAGFDPQGIFCAVKTTVQNIRKVPCRSNGKREKKDRTNKITGGDPLWQNEGKTSINGKTAAGKGGISGAGKKTGNRNTVTSTA